MNFGSAPRTLLRAAAVALVASSAGACSSVPSWMNPFGDEEPQVADDAAVAPADGTTPDLASVPDRPVQTSTPDSQKQVVASLAADRSRANYSSDALRGDAAVPAAPPGPPVPVDTSSSSDSAVADTTPTSAEAGPTTDAAAAAGDTTSDNSMPAPVASAAVPAASASPAVSSPTPAVGSAPAVGSTYPRGEPAVPGAVARTMRTSAPW